MREVVLILVIAVAGYAKADPGLGFCEVGGFYAGVENQLMIAIASEGAEQYYGLKRDQCELVWNASFQVGRRLIDGSTRKSDISTIDKAMAYQQKVLSVIIEIAGPPE